MVIATAKEVSKEVVEQELRLGQGLGQGQGQGVEAQPSLRRARLVKGGGSLANL